MLDTLLHLRHETDVWLQITTLLIPGHTREIDASAAGSADHPGTDVPLHFTAFHPDYKMRDVPPTRPAALTRARRIAQRHGLRFVHTGDVHDRDGGQTTCSGCGVVVVERDWYVIGRHLLSDDGRCSSCGTSIPGRFDRPVGRWGARRLPVTVTGHDRT